MSYSEQPAQQAYEQAGRGRSYPAHEHENDRSYGRERPRSYDDHGFQSRSGRGGRGGRGGYSDGGYGRDEGYGGDRGYGRGGYGRGRGYESRGGEGSYRSRDEQGYRQEGFRKRSFEDASRGPPRDFVPGTLNGTVKWFNSTKGFGFITPEDGGAEVFVHHSAIQAGGFRSLNDGDQVSYNMQTGRDGRAKAADVSVTAAAEPDAGPKRTRRHDDYEHA